MIGITKLLCGQATVSAAMRGRAEGRLAPHLLQFSAENRPLVVWNTTNRCNLNCSHCYISAEDRRYSGELTTAEARTMIDDLGAMRVPVLLFSGGEPLMRADVLDLARYAAERALRPVLSTNGTLIDPAMAGRIKAAGFQYAGVSLDGLEATHDRFRRRKGAFRKAVQGIKNANAAGVKCGVRFTINAMNHADLPGILDLVEELGIPRFCMYHLVYAGRGRDLMAQDITADQRRQALVLLIERVLDWERRGVVVEVLTTDQHADGVFLHHFTSKHRPERADEVRSLLAMHGGCSAGCKMANVDPLGNVHPCQFWSHVTLGNVRERPFSEIWQDAANPVLAGLRRKHDLVKGRCGACAHKAVCGGCRIRAETALGDVWAEDPACYLTEEERAADRSVRSDRSE